MANKYPRREVLRTPNPTAIGWVAAEGVALIGPFAIFFLIGFLVVALVVYAALSSLIGALLIWLVCWRLPGKTPRFEEIYLSALTGWLCALVIDFAWDWFTGSVNADTLGMIRQDAIPTSYGDILNLKSLGQYLSWLWPAFFITPLSLLARTEMFDGLAGYLRAMVISVICLPLSLYLPLVFLMGLQLRLTGTPGIGDGVFLALLGLTAMLLIFAALGAVLAAGVPRFVSRASDAAALTWRRSYFTTFLALLAWAGITAVVMFFVPVFDPYADHLFAMASRGSALSYVNQYPGIVNAGLATFLVLQLPGLLVSTKIISARMGPLPYWRALAVTTMVVTVTLPLVLFLMWSLAAATP